jgi:hypothetical protein
MRDIGRWALAWAAGATISCADAQVVYEHLQPSPPIGAVVSPGYELGEFVTPVGGAAPLGLVEFQFGAFGSNGTTGTLTLNFYNDGGGQPGTVLATFAQPVNLTGAGPMIVSYNVGSLAIPASVWIAVRLEQTSGDIGGVIVTPGSPTVGSVSSTRVFRNGSSGPWGSATVSDWMEMRLTAAAPAACYANCDHGTTQPCLNVLDFGCFLNRFAAGDTYCNCDNSTSPPILNVLDFNCFLNKFAAGCSSC